MLQTDTNPISALEHKEERLVTILQDLKSAVVGFSGGVDSAYLAYMANRVLGKNALCVTALSPSFPSYQLKETTDFVDRFQLNHFIIHTDELENPQYLENSPDRCYFCKSELFTSLQAIATEKGYHAILDGTNRDDLGDFRPGRKAAAENAVRSPLLEAEMTKLDIRELSRRAGLPTWDKPALPCLSSRFPYGISISAEKLSVVDKGETILKSYGFRIFRVRYHESLVRLEFSPEELPKALNLTMAAILLKEFKALGFKFVTVDLEGYRSGALNEVLP
ncbi:MAG TPA: ATP-dependent sacrificial sulfur transferase LarE [Terriglobia bacterium]|nr:ATP-dependent sacrificial sulfur transferase LarE [Terriglobia bacterium]